MQSRIISLGVDRTVCLGKIVNEHKKESGRSNRAMQNTIVDRFRPKAVTVYHSKEISLKGNWR